METSVNRIAYAYLQQEQAEMQEKNLTSTKSKNILKRLLNVFHKFSKSNGLEA